MPKIVNDANEVAQVNGTLLPVGNGIIIANNLNGVEITNTPEAGQVLVATSPTSAAWTGVIDCNN